MNDLLKSFRNCSNYIITQLETNCNISKHTGGNDERYKN
nr:MAG TPA: hypothetical protein [Caudoviricetes sp.]